MWLFSFCVMVDQNQSISVELIFCMQEKALGALYNIFEFVVFRMSYVKLGSEKDFENEGYKFTP